jgi:adenine-specific DNA glycosylase
MDDQKALLRQRPSEGLLANMLEFPQYLTTDIDEAIRLFETEFNCQVAHQTILKKTIKHVFTHKIWQLKLVKVTGSEVRHPLTSIHALPKAMSKAHLKIIDLLKAKS